jgi:hypothetical protein
MTQPCNDEPDLAMKESLFSSLSNFLKGHNFEGKRLFIRDYDGLAFLTKLFCTELPLRFRKKIIMLLNDLVMYDDHIFGNEPNGDKFYVRRFYTHRDDVILRLLSFVTGSDLDNMQE